MRLGMIHGWNPCLEPQSEGLRAGRVHWWNLCLEYPSKGLQACLLLQHLPTMHKALVSIPNTAKNKEKIVKVALEMYHDLTGLQPKFSMEY